MFVQNLIGIFSSQLRSAQTQMSNQTWLLWPSRSLWNRNSVSWVRTLLLGYWEITSMLDSGAKFLNVWEHGLLRDNFSASFWRRILECVRAYKQTHLRLFHKHPNLRLLEDGPLYNWRLEGNCKYFLVCNYQSDSRDEVPKISVQDIILGCGGSTLSRGEFKALAWRSRIPPYYNSTISCKMQAPQPTVERKKRVSREEGHLI